MGSGASSLGKEAEEKRKGDEAFRYGDYLSAVLHYSEAIEAASLSNEYGAVEAAVVYSNRSAAFYMCGRYDDAVDDGKRAIFLQPRWAKGYFRAAKALLKTDQIYEAYDNLEKAQALAPKDEIVSKELKQVEKMIEQCTSVVGGVYSWGLGSTCGLGHPDIVDKIKPTPVSALARKYIVDVSCGAMHTAAVSVFGDVYCWGNNKYNHVGVDCQEGKSRNEPVVLVPQLVPGLVGIHVNAVSCGAGHTVICTSEGRVYSWGVGQQGQLGHGSELNVSVPTALQMDTEKMAAITCGIAHTFFLTDGGKLYACGQNTYGALGMDSDGENVLRPTGVTIPGSAKVNFVSCGGAHTAVIDASGQLFTTGSNTCGQLGLGDFSDFIFTFSTVTKFDFEVSTVSNALWCDNQVRRESYGRTMLPKCSYVSCGEEFTAVVTEEHDVFTVGLGLGGQLGLGANPDKICIFQAVSTLKDKRIEEISCSQGTVYAISQSGDVYSWGVTRDYSSFGLASIEDNFKVIPTRNVYFDSKRKKVRQLSCGRNHFVSLMLVPYGPASVPLHGLQPGSDYEGAEVIIVKKTEVQSGKKLRFSIQSRDTRGEDISFGGSHCFGRAVLLDECESRTLSSLNNNMRERPDVQIDDNLDGTYSGESRFFLVGEYDLSISLDGLAIQGSPFRIVVTPGPLHGPSSKMSLAPFQSCVLESITVKPEESQTIWIKCFDENGNLFPLANDSYAFLQCKCSDRVVHNECCELNIDENSEARCVLIAPSETGTYCWSVGIGGLKESQLLPGRLCTRVVSSAICPSRCSVHSPTTCMAGDRFRVDVELRDEHGDNVIVHADDMPVNVFSVVFPSEEYDICPRAVIQLYDSFEAVTLPSTGVLLDFEQDHVLSFEHCIRVAGLSCLEVRIEDQVIFKDWIEIQVGKTSPLFVELLNASHSLSAWKDINDSRLLKFQCNDQFGNARKSGGDQLEVCLWVEKDSSPPLKYDMMCTDRDNGFHDVRIGVLGEDAAATYMMKVSVNGQEICYSPFCFNCNMSEILPTEISKYEGIHKEHVAAKKISQDEKKRATINKENLAKFDEIRRKEKTAQRAAQALMNKKKQIRQERMEKMHSRYTKRTGGGFIVQYSKDV